MRFRSQTEYAHYHSPEQRRIRSERAKNDAERAVSEALSLFQDGEEADARQHLFDRGFSDDGIAEYMRLWKS